MADEQAQMKAISPFLQRADEMQINDPKVAYYCRMYAAEQALKFKPRAPSVDSMLRTLLGTLEKDKANAGLGDNDKDHCRTFAEGVFSRADRVDRAGRANKGTALTFLAASFFIDILRQFGELAPELEDMQKYAAWKAADINKALREGRTPTPGNGDAAPADLSLPGVPSHASEPPVPQGDPRSSANSSVGFGSEFQTPSEQQPAYGTAADVDELPGVPPPGQHYHPPSPSFQRVTPPPPSGGHSPSQFQTGPPQQQPPQSPPQWDHDSWQQPSWHSSDPPGPHSQPPMRQGGYGLDASSSMPPPSGYGQPPAGPSLHQQDSMPSPRAGYREDSPSPPPPGGRTSLSPDPALEAARRAYASQHGSGPRHSASLGATTSFSRSESVLSTASSVDNGPQGHPVLVARFLPGARVLYDAYDEPAPVRGTVAKSEWKDKEFVYTVALQKRIVQVSEHILAPEYQPGDKAGLRSDGGTIEPVYVLATNAQQWRPTYLVSLQSGQELTVGDDRLVSPHQHAPHQHTPQHSQLHSQSEPSAEARQSQTLKHSTYVPEAPTASDLGGSSFTAPRGAPPRAPPQSQPMPRRQSTERPATTAAPLPPKPASAAPAATAVPYVAVPGYKPPLSAVMEAQKLAKYAGSSLGFEDVNTAIKNLNDALRLLTMPQPGR